MYTGFSSSSGFVHGILSVRLPLQYGIGSASARAYKHHKAGISCNVTIVPVNITISQFPPKSHQFQITKKMVLVHHYY